ncbi:MAG: hypothetical protein OEW63_00840 [Gammaproteobacteria bacterium]|nr:hypothetical protein [Gammaproteobacteria bacterium]
MKRLLTFTLIVTHVLINCAWASAHMAEGVDKHGYESAHVHLYTLLSALDDADNGDSFLSYDHEEEAHIHLVFYLFSVDSFKFEQTIVQKRSHFRIPFENNAVSPPVPPPIA